MSKERIQIKDFEMFYDIVKSIGKMADGVKFSVDGNGLVVYSKNDYSKCNLVSNSISSSNAVEFCIGELGTLVKVLTTVKEMYRGKYDSVSMFYEEPFFRIESGKFKTKINTCEESRISKYVATKIKTEIIPKLEFTTNSEMIKAVNGHSFIFKNLASARIYVTVEKDMQNNTIFATIGDDNDLSDSITLELGLINSGSLDNEDGTQQKIILNFDRLNILNMFPSDEIKVTIPKNAPILMSTITRNGKNGSFFESKICSFMMVR